MVWNEDTRNYSELETKFTEQKLLYDCKQDKIREENSFVKYKQQLVFNELNEFKEFYLNQNPNLKSKVIYDDYLSSRCVYTEGETYNIKPSFIKKFVHFKKFKYVLGRLYLYNNTVDDPLSRDNTVLYDNPTFPIIEKLEPIDLETLKNLRPNRFPCNFEKVYNESDFSKYLIVHYHKIKNRQNLDYINKDSTIKVDFDELGINCPY
jgi:hypothetical protein